MCCALEKAQQRVNRINLLSLECIGRSLVGFIFCACSFRIQVYYIIMKYISNPAALQYTVEADFDRRPTRVKFVGAPGAVYKGFYSMPETDCHNLKLVLLVSNALSPLCINVSI